MCAAAGFFIALTVSAWLALAPWGLLALYMFVSTVSFAMYGIDKHAARTGRRRTAEATLHMVDLVGGWPGALVAQHLFRHKTRKLRYQFAFWAVVGANCAAAAWLLFGLDATMLPTIREVA